MLGIMNLCHTVSSNIIHACKSTTFRFAGFITQTGFQLKSLQKEVFCYSAHDHPSTAEATVIES